MTTTVTSDKPQSAERTVGASRDPSLPDFDEPPVVEVVLSIQFEPISGLTTAHVGLLWQRYRDRLSVIEEHPPLLPQSEHFGPPSPPRVNVAIEDKPPTPRVWFLNEQKTELVQVQNDRFAHNWRKVGRGQAYPRYENIRDRFREEVSGFEQFVDDENLGTLSVSQCELTYVNHIEQSETWGRHGQVEQVFRNWSPLPGGVFLPEPEDAFLQWRFRISGKDDKVAGRLHVVAQPSWLVGNMNPVWLMNLTARGGALGSGISGAFAFFDLAREWIVRGFADLTTEGMHRRWRRRDVQSGWRP